jgi:hypothetical protein
MKRRSGRSNERGATLAIIAVSMFLFLGLAALAVDLGMIKATGAQAQRAADAAALAGASAFVDFLKTDPQAVDTARARALDYATRQQLRTSPIAAGEVTVDVIPDSEKVRVHIERDGLPTWFANTFGVSSVSVGRTAAAVASTAGVSNNCIKPFFLPDIWRETTQDTNHNNILDNLTKDGEQWFYEPENGDTYKAFDPSNPTDPNATGYGAGRGGYGSDRGLPIMLKPQTGDAQRAGNYYFTLDGPLSNLQQNIEGGCISASVGDTPVYDQGSATGQARRGVQTLVDDDPSATWDQPSGKVVNSAFPDWTQSPRVITVGLFDPAFINPTCTDITDEKGKPAKNCKPAEGATFSTFARIFISAVDNNTSNITARFIGFVGGGGAGGETTGPLVKVLRLVE